MGQGQSQSKGRTLGDEGKVVLENRPETPESERVDPEERARLQAEVIPSLLKSMGLFSFNALPFRPFLLPITGTFTPFRLTTHASYTISSLAKYSFPKPDVDEM
jgi:hypothetical protein